MLLRERQAEEQARAAAAVGAQLPASAMSVNRRGSTGAIVALPSGSKERILKAKLKELEMSVGGGFVGVGESGRSKK